MRAARWVAVAALACGACAKVSRTQDRTDPKVERPDEPREQGVPPRGDVPRVPASPEALLAPGAVSRIQRALAERDLLRAHRDGELDGPTSEALRAFQEGEGLAATGFPDRETLTRLGIDPDEAYGRDREAGR